MTPEKQRIAIEAARGHIWTQAAHQRGGRPPRSVVRSVLEGRLPRTSAYPERWAWARQWVAAYCGIGVSEADVVRAAPPTWLSIGLGGAA